MTVWKAFVHISSYTFVFPYLGGFVFSYVKYVEVGMSPPKAIATSILAGLFAIFFYGVIGLGIGLLTLVGFANRHLHLLVNLLGCNLFVALATLRDEFFRPYLALLFGLSVLSAICLTALTKEEVPTVPLSNNGSLTK